MVYVTSIPVRETPELREEIVAIWGPEKQNCKVKVMAM